MDKETAEDRLKSLKLLQEKLKLDVEEQEVYIKAMEEYIRHTFK